MLAIRDAIIDDTVKPAIEWINGKAVQKLMPTDLHAILQLAFAKFIDNWAKKENKRDKVASEWRYIIPPNSYETESVVPDVAYLATYFDLSKNDRTYPTIPPNIAVEILSPDDKSKEVEAKRNFYLWWGVQIVLIVDPLKRTVEAHEISQPTKYYSEHDILTSCNLPSLTIPLHELFAELDEPT